MAVLEALTFPPYSIRNKSGQGIPACRCREGVGYRPLFHPFHRLTKRQSGLVSKRCYYAPRFHHFYLFHLWLKDKAVKNCEGVGYCMLFHRFHLFYPFHPSLPAQHFPEKLLYYQSLRYF